MVPDAAYAGVIPVDTKRMCTVPTAYVNALVCTVGVLLMTRV